MKKITLLFLCSVLFVLISFNRAWAAAPTINSTASTWVGATTTGHIYISWTKGNGTYRLVVCRPTSATAAVIPSSNSTNTTTYSANLIYGSGTSIATNNYVVYNNSGNSINISGLTSGTKYTVSIYEYNLTGTTREFLTSGYSPTYYPVEPTPATASTNLLISSISPTQVRIKFNPGSGPYHLVTMRPFANAVSNPVNCAFNTPDTVYGSGANLGNSNYVVASGKDTDITVTGLTAGTHYKIAVYEYDEIYAFSGFLFLYFPNTINYNTSFLSGSFWTFVAAPTAASSAIAVTPGTSAGTAGNAAITWTSSATGTYDLIVVGTSGFFSGPPGPSDGHYFTPNTVYGSGAPMLNNGFAYGYGYSVYSSTGTSVNITGLAPARNYTARVYAFNRLSNDSTCNYSSSSSASFSTYNSPPTINNIANADYCKSTFGTKYKTIALSNITDGGPETQNLTVTAQSSNTTLIVDSVSYTSPNTTGTVYLHYGSNATGTSTVTVTVNDGWTANNTTMVSSTITFRDYPNSPGSITGLTSVCKGTSAVSYSLIPVNGASTYTWAVPAGATIASGQGTTNISVNFASNATSGGISVYPSNSYGCTSLFLASTSVTLKTTETANAGADQLSLCGQTSTTIVGNTPLEGTGLWTVTSGSGGTFASASNPSTTFNGVAGNTYVLRWTVSNAPCTNAYDEVTIAFPKNPTTANAGIDQLNLCGVTQTTLAANTPTVGTGAWSVTGSGGTVDVPSSPTSTFHGVAGQTYTLHWTISNSPCTSSNDDVTIKFNQLPTTANAGPNQASGLCGLSGAVLSGNNPSVGTGLWTVQSGAGGSFVNPNTYNTVFNGTAGSAYNLRWTITNGPCVVSYDDVIISFPLNPTPANAGPDLTICNGTTITLGANSPAVGTGTWTLVNAGSASFVDASVPTTNANSFASNSYTYLVWNVSTQLCPTSSDTVKITSGPCNTTADFIVDHTSSCLSTGATFIFTSSSSSATGYSWDFGFGASPATANTVGPHTVTYSTSGYKDISLTVTGPGGTNNKTKTNFVLVKSNPAAAGVVSGSPTVCQGQSNVFYSVGNIANATTYNWSLPAGANIITGANGPTIVVNFANNSTSGNITVSGTNQCATGATSPAYALSVGDKPQLPGTITGPSIVCDGANGAIFNVPTVPYADTYKWLLSPGLTSTSLLNETSVPYISINVAQGITSGYVSVFGSSNSCGDGDTSATYYFSVNPYPGPASVITGNNNASACASQTLNYSINLVSNASSYTWDVSGLNNPNVTGNGTNSITINYGLNSTSGNLIVSGTNACGNGPSSTLPINFTPIPTAEESTVT